MWEGFEGPGGQMVVAKIIGAKYGILAIELISLELQANRKGGFH